MSRQRLQPPQRSPVPPVLKIRHVLSVYGYAMLYWSTLGYDMKSIAYGFYIYTSIRFYLCCLTLQNQDLLYV